MLQDKSKFSSIETSQIILKNLSEFVVKIDYFDQKGTKNFEYNIPLKDMFKKK